jgi:hypothetical protein
MCADLKPRIPLQYNLHRFLAKKIFIYLTSDCLSQLNKKIGFSALFFLLIFENGFA